MEGGEMMKKLSAILLTASLLFGLSAAYAQTSSTPLPQHKAPALSPGQHDQSMEMEDEFRDQVMSFQKEMKQDLKSIKFLLSDLKKNMSTSKKGKTQDPTQRMLLVLMTQNQMILQMMMMPRLTMMRQMPPRGQMPARSSKPQEATPNSNTSTPAVPQANPSR